MDLLHGIAGNMSQVTNVYLDDVYIGPGRRPTLTLESLFTTVLRILIGSMSHGMGAVHM